MTTQSETCKKARRLITCVIITAICVLVTFIALFTPIYSCKIQYIDPYGNQPVSDQQQDKDIFEACTKELRVLNSTLNITEPRGDMHATYSICDMHQSICLPVSILLMFLFVSVCCTSFCKGLELCCTVAFGGRNSLLEILGIAYNLQQKLDKHELTLKIEQDGEQGPVWDFVESIVHKTWLYNDQMGRDALNLTHNALRINHVYAIRNPDLLDRYESYLNHNDSREREVSDSEALPELLTHRWLTQRQKQSEYYAITDDNEMILSTSNSHANLQHMVKAVVKSDISEVCVAPSLQLREVDSVRYDEMFLFHGTKIENIKKIIERGFSMEKANTALLYGKGLYFTDSSQKADQYADSITNRRHDNLAMLIVRAAVGRVGYYDDQVEGSIGEGLDTLVAGSGKRFRELIKYNPAQCYPAFVVIYDRVCDTSQNV